MNTVSTYDEWRLAALAADRRSGTVQWMQRERSKLYDYKMVRMRCDQLQELRATGDPVALLDFLDEGVHGNMGGMGSRSLYARSPVGTKALVTRYIEELSGALEELEAADEKDLSLEDKWEFFERAAVCHGRSALMLSGAGSLGPFHFGVVKSLTEQGLLPRVLSGASAGSFVAAIAGTHKDEQLIDLLSTDGLQQLARLAPTKSSKRQIRVDDLVDMLDIWVPDMTFAEAHEETGRDINISVAPVGWQQQSRLLNAASSPNVLLREAVKASCAIPGIFPAVTLVARDARGKRRPYLPSRQWVDGAITNDQPKKQLSRMFGVNHFIASQTNPVVLWSLRDPDRQSGLFSQLVSIQQSATREWLRAMYPLAMNLVRGLSPLNSMTRIWFSVFTQEYTADINLIPEKRFFDPSMLLAKLTVEETEALVQMGERATWPKIEMIRNCTRVSRTIDGILSRLETRLVEAY